MHAVAANGLICCAMQALAHSIAMAGSGASISSLCIMAASGSVALTQAQLSMLLEGIDWRRPERTWRATTAL